MAIQPEPKRRNLAETRQRILIAASATFAEFGYAGASLRHIADRAGVAPSLVSKYFISKAGLFEQALLYVLRTNSVFTWDKKRFGEKMARLIPERGTTDITIMLALALTDPESAEIARRVSREHMIAPLVEWLGPPNARERAMNMFALTSGFVIQMRGLLTEAIPRHSLDWLATALQAIVDEGEVR